MGTIIYMLVNDIGAFTWWLFIRFGRTEFTEERGEKNLARNIFLFIVLLFIITYISINWDE